MIVESHMIYESKSKAWRTCGIYSIGVVAGILGIQSPQYRFKSMLLGSFFLIMFLYYLIKACQKPSLVATITVEGLYVKERFFSWDTVANISVRRSDTPAFKEVCLDMKDSKTSPIIINEVLLPGSAEELANLFEMYWKGKNSAGSEDKPRLG
jgi:hypothetical protein